MRRFKIWALLLSVSVLCVAAVGNSAPFKSGNVTLMDFEPRSGTLLGYPNDTPPLGWYVRTETTAFHYAVIPHGTPPSPCRALSVVWNIVIRKVPQNPDQSTALMGVLRSMALHNCSANITRDETVNPAPIIDLTPTP